MSKDESVFKMILSAVGVGVLFSIIAVIIFAFILNVTSLSDGVIKGVNQFVKILSVFIGCFFCLKGRMGYLKGGVCGLLIFAVTYLVFAMFVGTKVFGGSFFIDLIFGTITGVISGIIAVNLKKTA